MDSCVFCRIMRGEIPAHKIYEEPRIAAILDINPISWGHALVLPRDHYETWTDLPPDLAGDMAKAVQVVARAVMRAAGAEGFNLLVNNHLCSGQAIPHAHAHVIPRRTNDGVKFNWTPKPYDPGRIEKAAEAIRSAMGS